MAAVAVVNVPLLLTYSRAKARTSFLHHRFLIYNFQFVIEFKRRLIGNLIHCATITASEIVSKKDFVLGVCAEAVLWLSVIWLPILNRDDSDNELALHIN